MSLCPLQTFTEFQKSSLSSAKKIEAQGKELQKFDSQHKVFLHRL